MKLLIASLVIILSLTGCSTTHQHHHYQSDEVFIRDRKITSHHFNEGNQTVIVINYHRHLTRHDKKMLKRWYRNHHGIKHNRIRYRFILSG